ncbi:MAG: hypothetical protein Q9182_007465 [Xanthomendoza sp. 2 TL-2023]
MAYDNSLPTKRSASAIDFDIPTAKKRNLATSHHPSTPWDFHGVKLGDLAFNGNEEAELLLTRSIGLALEAVGFQAAEPLALESFRLAVEEYIHDFLADVRQSMLSCRRILSIPPDFLQALHTHQLSLRALVTHLDPPVARRKARTILSYEPQQEEQHYNHDFLGATLNGGADERIRPYVPRHFPSLPSKHTYQATAEFPSREEDPRKIRERATEEGRLGEEALRRLVSAKSIDRPFAGWVGQRGKSIRASRDDMWKETMQAASSVHMAEQSKIHDIMDTDDSGLGSALLDKPSSDYERLSSAVNADMKYWRKPASSQGTNQENNGERHGSVSAAPMSVEILGANLLREVKVEGLDEVLRTLRMNHGAQRSNVYTSQTSIDQLLNAFASSRTSSMSLDQPNAVQHHPNPVLEFVGASPCSGKKQIISHLIARLILPQLYEGCRLGGRESAVILIDSNNSFSILRLRDIMLDNVRLYFHKRSQSLPADVINNLVRSSLDHLHIFRPQSSPSLLATLSNVQSYILDMTSHTSANRTVGAIFLNDLDAFLWQDRLEDAEEQPIEVKGQRSGLLSSRFRDLVALLRRLQTDFSCPVFATTSALSSTTFSRIDGHMVPALQSHLPSVWRSFVTARLILQRESICKFHHGMSAEEAVREAGQRRSAVENSMFTARLDWSDSEAWSEDTRRKIKGIHGGDFTFRVSGNLVEIDS